MCQSFLYLDSQQLRVIGRVHIQYVTYPFLLVFHLKYVISEILQFIYE